MLAMVCAAVAVSPIALIIDAKATYPKEVANLCIMLGKAILRQGWSTLMSGRMLKPLGEILS